MCTIFFRVLKKGVVLLYLRASVLSAQMPPSSSKKTRVSQRRPLRANCCISYATGIGLVSGRIARPLTKFRKMLLK